MFRPNTETVTRSDGAKVTGRLTRIDDFIVTLTDSEGHQHTFSAMAMCQRWRFMIRFSLIRTY